MNWKLNLVVALGLTMSLTAFAQDKGERFGGGQAGQQHVLDSYGPIKETPQTPEQQNAWNEMEYKTCVEGVLDYARNQRTVEEHSCADAYFLTQNKWLDKEEQRIRAAIAASLSGDLRTEALEIFTREHSEYEQAVVANCRFHKSSPRHVNPHLAADRKRIFPDDLKCMAEAAGGRVVQVYSKMYPDFALPPKEDLK